jgi:hypothetical protein
MCLISCDSDVLISCDSDVLISCDDLLVFNIVFFTNSNNLCRYWKGSDVFEKKNYEAELMAEQARQGSRAPSGFRGGGA